MADAPLEDIVDLILRVNAGAYSIEAANVRHEHEWRVWEDVKLAEGKSLIPGVVTHHTLSVEHPRLVADRLVRYARLLGRENVIGGTDCGFQQGAGVERVHPDGHVGQAAGTRRWRPPGKPGALARLTPPSAKTPRAQAPTGVSPRFCISPSMSRRPPLRVAHSSCGTIQNTSNSLPSGSWAYRLRLEPWSLTPTSALAAISASRALGQFGQRVHLPGEVVQAHTFAARWIGRIRADAEQTQVMIVVGVRARLQEVGAVAHVRGDHKPENILVEAGRALGVADVEYGVIEAFDFEHRISPVSCTTPSSDAAFLNSGRRILRSLQGEPGRGVGPVQSHSNVKAGALRMPTWRLGPQTSRCVIRSGCLSRRQSRSSAWRPRHSTPRLRRRSPWSWASRVIRST